MVTDENLRHGAPTASSLHIGALRGSGFHVDLFDRHILGGEQLARSLLGNEIVYPAMMRFLATGFLGLVVDQASPD